MESIYRIILSAGPNVFVLPEIRTEFERTTLKPVLVSKVIFFNAKNVIMVPAGRGGRGKTSQDEPLPISQLEPTTIVDLAGHFTAETLWRTFFYSVRFIFVSLFSSSLVEKWQREGQGRKCSEVQCPVESHPRTIPTSN